MIMTNQKLEWNWKDGNRFWWRLVAEPDGEIQNRSEMNPDGDWQWVFDLFNESGDLIHQGYFVGQSDHPPRLQHFLYVWQCDVASVVIDGCCYEVNGLERL